MILDGWGLSKKREGNAIACGNTPNMDNYFRIYPHTSLAASGAAVGLPDGQMGNSEVGHLNIGAGRVIYQELTRISKAVDDGDFFKNPVLNKAFSDMSGSGDKSLHLMGLVSDGGVHSHIKHLKALIDMAAAKDIKNLYIHAFLDGRDVPPRSAAGYLEELENYLQKKPIGEIATVCGRYYAMDRDNRWDRVKKAYDCLVYRDGKKFKSSVELIKKSYDSNIDDEFVVPGIIDIDNDNMGRIKNGDSVIFFNFRPDRARELTAAFIGSEFLGFDRGQEPPEINIISMTLYNQKFNIPIAFPPQKIADTLGEVISKNGLKQLRIAETEKYAHVTFFFNGGIEQPYPGEDRILIPSPDIATYDKKPEMSANEVAEELIARIKEDIYDVIILNFANADMVGHTGIFDAAVRAIETVDECVGKVVAEINKIGGIAMITADHGNAEEMISPDGHNVITAHSVSPVPFIFCSRDHKIRDSERKYKLSDIAPTILNLLNIDKPPLMTGISII